MLSLTDMQDASLSKIVRDDKSFPLQFEEMSDDFKEFKTVISEIVKSNLNLLSEIPLPKHFNIEEIRDFFKRQIKSDLEKDLLLEKSVEVSKYAKNMCEFMDSYFREIFGHYEQRQKKLFEDMFCISKMFLNSDLPMIFMKTIEGSILAEKDYLGVFVKKIHKERLSLIRNRSNRIKFRRVCNSHNIWVENFRETLAKMERARVKLIWYVDFNNSGSLDEIFKDKFMKTNLLNKKQLLDFIDELQNQVNELEKLNAPMMELRSFIPFEFDEDTRAMRKIMQILR